MLKSLFLILFKLKRLHRENIDPLDLPEPVRRGVWETRVNFFLPFVKEKKVLELGCGYGYDAFLLSKVAKKVVGVDLDQKAIEKARRKFQDSGNLEFFVADAVNFLKEAERKGETFDIVCLFEFIEHIEEKKQRDLIQRIFKIIKPQGRLLLSMPNGKIVPLYRKNPYHKRELSLKELLELLEAYFEIEEVKGQIHLIWFFIPLPWAWLERIWILFHLHNKVYIIRNNPETSRTILLRARRKIS